MKSLFQIIQYLFEVGELGYDDLVVFRRNGYLCDGYWCMMIGMEPEDLCSHERGGYRAFVPPFDYGTDPSYGLDRCEEEIDWWEGRLHANPRL